MKININGQDFRVRFEYTDENGNFGGKALSNLKDKRIFTTAIIQERQDGDGEPSWKDVTRASSIRNPLDQFNKGRGRRQALSRVLKNLDANDRQAVWQAYENQHKDGAILKNHRERRKA